MGLLLKGRRKATFVVPCAIAGVLLGVEMCPIGAGLGCDLRAVKLEEVVCGCNQPPLRLAGG